MSTFVHFLNVGQGNMSFIETTDGRVYFFDCNITDEREDEILEYIAEQIGWGATIDAFICSHRDADHMRGIRTLHEYFPIRSIWDSDYPGTTTNTPEYAAYMDLRRRVGAKVLQKQRRFNLGRTRLRILSAADDRLDENANAQGIVIKVEHLKPGGSVPGSSAMLTGDSDAETWRYGILADYAKDDISCDILVAGHHGSISFFDDPADTDHYYTGHVEAMSPAMTLVSVGNNPHGHPDKKALELYETYSRGSKKGNKIYRTDKKGTMKLELKDAGWHLKSNQ